MKTLVASFLMSLSILTITACAGNHALPPPPNTPIIDEFSSSTLSINKGDTVLLKWRTTNTSSVSIFDGKVTESGKPSQGSWQSSKLEANTTFVLTAYGAGTNVSSTLNVVINGTVPPPTVQITASPTTIKSGETSKLTWSTKDADTISISGLSGPLDLSGFRDVKPTQTTTFVLIATGHGGMVQASATITVDAPPPPVFKKLSDPTVKEVPISGANNVPKDSQIEIPFSNPINSSSVKTNLNQSMDTINITYIDKKGATISVPIAWQFKDSKDDTLEITANGGFIGGTKFTLAVTSGLTDIHNQALTTPIQVSFTTGGTPDGVAVNLTFEQNFSPADFTITHFEMGYGTQRRGNGDYQFRNIVLDSTPQLNPQPSGQVKITALYNATFVSGQTYYFGVKTCTSDGKCTPYGEEAIGMK